MERFASHPYECICPRKRAVPTLTDVKDTYGESAALLWLTLQLNKFNETNGPSRKMSGEQLEDLARTFLFMHGGYKVTEIMLFIGLFKAGKFGKGFFGNVDPLVITSIFVDDFLPYRGARIAELQREKDRELNRIYNEGRVKPYELTSEQKECIRTLMYGEDLESTLISSQKAAEIEYKGEGVQRIGEGVKEAVKTAKN